MDSFRVEEVQLAARNHGMPLEALRYPVTPAGLHYLLIHYDIPAVDPRDWSLTVGGRVEAPVVLGLEDLCARPAVDLTATMECAGNGRALLAPRPFSQPWLDEAVGTGCWRGAAVKPLLEECGVLGDAVEVVFTGLDRGIENGLEQDFARSLSLADAMGDGVVLAYELNGRRYLPSTGSRSAWSCRAGTAWPTSSGSRRSPSSPVRSRGPSSRSHTVCASPRARAASPSPACCRARS